MKKLLLVPAAALLFSLAGCADHVYQVDHPFPPPTLGPSALLQLADGNGYRAGFEDGRRDAYYNTTYRARRNPIYAQAPGYDDRLGPPEPYVNGFRLAYLRGYDQGFHR